MADKGFSLPTAQEVMEKLALAEAEKASAGAKKQAEAEAEKKMLLEKLTKPSGVSDEEALRRVAAIIERAVSNGLTEVQVYRFPNAMVHGSWPCHQSAGDGLGTDAHRPTEGDVRVLGRPRGYKLMVQIVDFPDGMSASP
jgi:hypothetical protein